MLFSIITVCYNSSRTIRRTFDSILAQDCRDYEYLVIDGASTDGTQEIIRAYEPNFEGRMKWISEPDKGIYDAMNKGLAMARGNFINMMNSDDELLPGALQAVAYAAARHPEIQVFYGLEQAVGEDGREKYLCRPGHLDLWHGSIRHQAAFIARQAHQTYGDYRWQLFPIAADYDVFLRFYLAGVKFHPVDCILSRFYMGGISSLDPMASFIDFHRVKYYHIRQDGFGLRGVRLLSVIGILKLEHSVLKLIKGLRRKTVRQEVRS